MPKLPPCFILPLPSLITKTKPLATKSDLLHFFFLSLSFISLSARCLSKPLTQIFTLTSSPASPYFSNALTACAASHLYHSLLSSLCRMFRDRSAGGCDGGLGFEAREKLSVLVC
ncbi:unnamed protein product [Rhodiola kirilowii]